MMRKFLYLVKFSLKNRLFKKGFIISQVIILLMMLVIMNLGSIISFFGSDEGPKEIEVLVFDETDDQKFYNQITSEEGQKFNFTLSNESFDEEKTDDYYQDFDMILITNEENSDIMATYYAKNLDLINQMNFENLLSTVRFKIIYDSLSEEAKEDFEILLSGMEITYYPKEDSNALDNILLNAISMVLLIPMFILIVFLTQMVSMEIIEEKASRSIEIMISNVTPLTHFAAKVTSALSFIIMQFLLILVYALVGCLVSFIISGQMPFDSIMDSLQLTGVTQSEMQGVSSMFSRIPEILLVVLIFSLSGMILYIILSAVFSSMATSAEDYQQFQMPIMMLLLVGFYIGIFGGMYAPGAVFVKICAYIPFFSPLVVPLLYSAGQMTVLEVCLAGGILVIFNVILIYIALPLYKTAILNYSQEKFLQRVKKIFKSSKYSD